jgi:hypothetical protein
MFFSEHGLGVVFNPIFLREKIGHLRGLTSKNWVLKERKTDPPLGQD